MLHNGAVPFAPPESLRASKKQLNIIPTLYQLLRSQPGLIAMRSISTSPAAFAQPAAVR